MATLRRLNWQHADHYQNAVLISETLAKRRAIFLSVRKTVHIEGDSELRKPMKTREYIYSHKHPMCVDFFFIKQYIKHKRR